MADLQTPLCMIFSTAGFDYHQPIHLGCSATSIAPIVTRCVAVPRPLCDATATVLTEPRGRPARA